MLYRNIYGVPDFECTEYAGKTKDYVLLIPIINEGERITRELSRAKEHGISAYADIVICDGGSTDGCTDEARLRALNVKAGSHKVVLDFHPQSLKNTETVAYIGYGVLALLIIIGVVVEVRKRKKE
mgnify:CR=1 FL=1